MVTLSLDVSLAGVMLATVARRSGEAPGSENVSGCLLISLFDPSGYREPQISVPRYACGSSRLFLSRRAK